MDLNKQTTQTRPENLQEVKEWLARIGKNKTYIISPFTERIGDFNETETGVYICNLEESAESEFLALHDGTVDNLVDYLYFLGAEKDWKEVYSKPQTLNDIRNWLIRSEKGWVFDISDKTMCGLSYGINITIISENAKVYGIDLNGTHFIPILDEKGKEYDKIINFLASNGVDPDWEIPEEVAGEESTDIDNSIISKPTTLYEIEDWIRRMDPTKYNIIKMRNLPKGPIVSTDIYIFTSMLMEFKYEFSIDHEVNDYDEVILYLSRGFGIKPDWE